MSIAFVSALLLAIDQWGIAHNPIKLSWFTVGDLSFGADLILSDRSLLMLVVVAFISLLVHLYSTVYMNGDAGWKRFFAMLGFFTFSMQGIVLTDNLLFLFIFWELVGFSSYMLIGHWNNKVEAGKAATKAFVMNRIGDAGFLVGLMILWTQHETFSISTIVAEAGTSPLQTAAALCIFCGIVGKSAQFPLFTWLPDAMEGPTPVSALIHAATMVAAGVYLLVRIFDFFTIDALLVVAVVGMITSIIGALAALSQNDIKKVLAYSTMSQLGLMILALGMGARDAAFLHLLTHAFFKACLFLAAGSVIHSLHEAQGSDAHFDAQDMRNMGGLRKSLPVTFLAFAISGASLAGVPFSSGFLSKEAILTHLFVPTDTASMVMAIVVIAVSFLTVLYTFRMIWLVFLGEARGVKTRKIPEAGWPVLLPLAILALCSLWFTVSPNPFGGSWLIQAPHSAYSILIALFSVFWILAALITSWRLMRKPSFETPALFRNAFYIDLLLTKASTRGIRFSSRVVHAVDRRVIDGSIHASAYAQVITAHVVAWFDRTFIDGTVNATARLMGLGGKITRSFQGGNIQLYIFWSVFAIIIFIIWLIK